MTSKFTFAAAASAALATTFLIAPVDVLGRDTDIFTATGAATAPNVLFVLDNTSNWSRNNQFFPDGNGGTITQAQAEVAAIKSVVAGLTGSINVGLMAFVPAAGSATDNGGYVRQAIVPMGTVGTNSAANRSAFQAKLQQIYDNYDNSQIERNNSGLGYGNLFYDVYNYLAGNNAYAQPANVPASVADVNGYTSAFSRFKSPFTSDSACGSTYIIFIGNPPARGPTADAGTNLSALSSAGGNSSQLQLQAFTSSTVRTPTNLGYSSACFASQPTGTPADFAAQCPPSSNSAYASCSYSTTDKTTALPACPTGQSRYSVLATGPANSTTTTTVSADTRTAPSSSCYANPSQWNSSDKGGLVCPVGGTTSTFDAATQTTTTTQTSYSACTYSIGNTPYTPKTCNGGRDQYTVTQSATKTVTVTQSSGPPATTTLGNTMACFATAPTGTPSDYTCPAGATCSYGSATSNAICPSGSRYQAVGYADVLTSVPTNPAVFATDNATFNADEWARFMYQKGIPVAGSTVNAFASTYTVDVYGAQPNAQQSSLLSSMAKNGGGGYYSATNANAIKVVLQNIFAEIQAKNSTFASAALPVSASTRTQNGNEVFVGTFRPDSRSLPRWFGNLKKYVLGTVNGGTDLVDSLNKAAVNPNTGFFTPCAASFWNYDTGNYWANVSGSVVSPRVFFTQATTPGTAWQTVGDDLLFAKSDCTTLGSAYSDYPDGPSVEKGGVASMLRKAEVARNVQTLSGASLVGLTTTTAVISANTTVNANLVNFIKGIDVTGEINGAPSTTALRPSIHGSVVHSRPLAIDYGGTVGVKVFYGSNDGLFRAINSSTGNEEWSFVAPESFPYLQRLMDNSPAVQSPTPTPSGQIAAPGTPGDYFFDGSSGVYQTFKNVTSTTGTGTTTTISVADKVWIYPTMRRGGRMIYGFDMSTTDSSGAVVPAFKWKKGCDGSGTCSAGMSRIGETWSTPNVANIPGYPSTTTSGPVLVVGGGYDTCEDEDSATPSCGSSPLGNVIYVLDADDGHVVASFSTLKSVAADVSLVDINQDGKVDAAYAADTGGNIYRINFTDPATYVPRVSSSWTITRVAYTNGGSRKFLFAPALLPYQNKVYVAIGSGDREHPTSLSYPYTTPVTNRFYVYLDTPSALDTELVQVAQNLDSSGGVNPLISNRTSTNSCSDTQLLPTSDLKGYYMDLTANGIGEQVVTSALISSGVVFFNTNRPLSSATSCANPLGEARGYAVNLLNGSGAVGASNGLCGGNRSGVFVGGGLAPSPVAGVVKVGDTTQIVVIGGVKLDGSVNTPVGGQKLQPPIGKTRKKIYWRSNTDTR